MQGCPQERLGQVGLEENATPIRSPCPMPHRGEAGPVPDGGADLSGMGAGLLGQTS